MRTTIPLTSLLLIGTLSGCVSVKTPDVDVLVNQFDFPSQSSGPEENVNYTPYAAALNRVTRQEGKVVKALNERDWEEVVDEAGDWLRDARELSGHANTSHDPTRFRGYCDALLREMQVLRQAALRRDAGSCERAIQACEPVLDRFIRTFPLTQGPPPADSSSPPPRGSDPGKTHSRP